MKKLIYGSLFLAILGIGIVGCKKETINEGITPTSVVESNKDIYDISLEEFEYILNSQNSEEKAPPWWEKFKKWVNSHSGSSQIYVEGQPSCSGGGGCGPCAGLCVGGMVANDNNDGQISAEDLSLGLSPIAFSIFVNSADENQIKLVIQIPLEYEENFIMNGTFRVEKDEVLPSFYVNEAGFNSILMKKGIYPVIRSSIDGMSRTIVNITVD